MKINCVSSLNQNKLSFGKLIKPEAGDENFEAFNKYVKARVNTESGPKLNIEELFKAIDTQSESIGQGYDITLTPKTKEDSGSKKIKTIEFTMTPKGENKPVFHNNADYKNFINVLKDYAEHVRINVDKFRKNK